MSRAQVLGGADGLVIQILSRDPTHQLRLVQAECWARFRESTVEIVVPAERDCFGIYGDLILDLWVALVVATGLGGVWGSLVSVRRSSWSKERKAVGIFSGETAAISFADALSSIGLPCDLNDELFVGNYLLAMDRFVPEPDLWATSRTVFKSLQSVQPHNQT